MKRAWLSLLFLILKLVIAGILIGIAYYVPGQGDTQLRFVDYVVDIKTGALAAGAMAAIIIAIYLFKFFAWVKDLPAKLKLQLRQRRLNKAKECLLESYIALSSGELETAVDLAVKSKNLDKNGLFHDIFEAQALFMAGEIDRAEIKFDRLRQFKNTKFLGLRGLISIRKKQSRPDEARLLLIEALKDRPNSVWVLKELLDHNLKYLEFAKANTVIEQLRITGHLDKKKSNRYKSIVAWLQAQQAKRLGNTEEFESYGQQSLKLDPTLTAATLDLSSHYYSQNQTTKALKLIENGYEVLPHTDYLPILRAVLTGESALDQYRIAEDTISRRAEHRVTHIILASFAISAKLWGQARLHLNILKEKPSQLVYTLLAELEQAEHPTNSDVISEYLKLAVQAVPEGEWMCHNCHTSQVSWSVFCQSCQSFDQISWQEALFSNSELIKIH